MGISYAYDALGNVVGTRCFGGASDLAYRYTGQEFDGEMGLHNFRARMYDSELFRFYATDPAGQDFSPYAFAGNAPVMYVDRDGRAWFIPVVLVLGAAMNVASNWSSITQNGFDVGRLFGYAAVGAGSSALGLVTGPLAPLAMAGGGFGSGVLNTLIGGGSLDDALSAGANSILPSRAGGLAGQAIGGLASGITINGTNLGSIAQCCKVR